VRLIEQVMSRFIAEGIGRSSATVTLTVS